jgi:hypothetical protein
LPHGIGAPAWHAPEPLHVAAGIATPPAHEAAPHAVPDGQSAQAPALQLPSRPQVDAAMATHRLRGSGAPFKAGPQVPFMLPFSAAEHAWHAVSHAMLQQNPSTQ